MVAVASEQRKRVKQQQQQQQQRNSSNNNGEEEASSSSVLSQKQSQLRLLLLLMPPPGRPLLASSIHKQLDTIITNNIIDSLIVRHRGHGHHPLSRARKYISNTDDKERETMICVRRTLSAKTTATTTAATNTSDTPTPTMMKMKMKMKKTTKRTTTILPSPTLQCTMFAKVVVLTLIIMMTTTVLPSSSSSSFCSCSFLLQGVDAKVTLTQYNKTYTSMPAMFGGLLSREEPPVLAHLVYMKDRPLMCSSSSSGSSSGSATATASGAASGEQEQQEQSGNGNKNDDDNSATNNSTTTTIHQKIQTPSDGLPVAVLVERGSCTFWEKAEEAAKLGDAVRYVVVYDNEMSPDLVPMSSEFPSNMTLFFVSMMSGHEIRDLILKKMISGYPYDPETSGLLVEIDGESPPLPPGYTDGPHLNLAAYFLAAMSGFLAFLVFFGCILIFAQCGWIIAHPDERGRIVLFGGGARPNFGGGAGRVETAKHLLTMEQVMSLEEIEYEADGGGGSEKGGDDNTNDNDQENDFIGLGVDEEGSSCCCAICIDEFEDKEKARRLPCRHMFHEDCLIPWLTERHASCPMCKYDVLQHILDSEKDDGNGSKSIEQSDDMPTNSDTLEADSGAATETSTQSRSTPPHLLFWNRITFGGWSRVRNDSQSEEESNGQTQRGGNNAREHEQQRQPSSEIELENRSTIIEIMSTATPSMTSPSHEEGP